jgi:uncharacterized membrane protein YdjX (TVP38/TMEM64 family)
MIGACLVLGMVVLLHFTPLRQLVDTAQQCKATLATYGWKAHVLFFAASVLAITLGFPRLLLCAISGILFGFVEGLLTSQFAGVTGSYGTFLLTRLWAPQDWVRRKLANREKLRALLGQPGLLSIFIARQLPVPGLVLNVLMGVLPTRHLTFLAATFFGYLPSNIPVALAGSSVGKDSLDKALTQASSSMLLLALFGLLILWIRRKYAAKAGLTPDDPESV